MIGSTDAHTGLAADGGGQLLRQDHAAGAEPGAHDRTRSSNNPKTGVTIMDWEVARLRLRRRLGRRRTRARRSWTRCSARRPTPPPARAWSCASSAAGTSRPSDAHTRSPAIVGYTKGVPMGGDLQRRARGQGADLPRRRAEGPDRRQPRPHPDRQGLARREGRAAREGLRRRLVRRPQARRGRQAAAGRQHRGRRERDLDQHHRRARADRGLEGPGLRPGAARLLLRPRDRDPDAALDRLRREALRRQAAARHAR